MTDLKHLLCCVHECRGGGAQTSSTSSVVFINVGEEVLNARTEVVDFFEWTNLPFWAPPLVISSQNQRCFTTNLEHLLRLLKMWTWSLKSIREFWQMLTWKFVLPIICPLLYINSNPGEWHYNAAGQLKLTWPLTIFSCWKKYISIENFCD